MERKKPSLGQTREEIQKQNRRALLDLFHNELTSLINRYGGIAYGLVVVWEPIPGQKTAQIQGVVADLFNTTDEERDRLNRKLVSEFKKWAGTSRKVSGVRSIILED